MQNQYGYAERKKERRGQNKKICADQLMSSLPEVSWLGCHVVALVAQVPHTLVHPRLVQLQVARGRRHVVTLATRMDF